MSDGWAIAGVVVSSTSSLIAAGALWVTVVTQRRQQDEKIRAQAAKVVLSSAVSQGRPDEPHINELRVDNLSDLPIHNVSFRTFWTPAAPPLPLDARYNSDAMRVAETIPRLEPGECMVYLYEAPAEYAGPYPRLQNDAIVSFDDAAGNSCERWQNGRLTVQLPLVFTTTYLGRLFARAPRRVS